MRSLAVDVNESLPMGQIVTALPRPMIGARAGKCRNNVLAMIRRCGGEACYGWALADFGPYCASGSSPPPLYRRWLNHVVWRDPQGQLWEVTPTSFIGNATITNLAPTEFLADPEATFDVVSEQEWHTRECRYVAVRPEGARVVELLTLAQHSTGGERTSYLQQSLDAIRDAGYRPKEWKIETLGERTVSIWLIAE